MSIRLVTALASVGLGAALVAPASAAARPAPTGFTPSATLGYSATSLASPTNGVVYVAGTRADGSVVVERRTSSTVQQVAVTASTSGAEAGSVGVQVTSAGGRTYLLTTGATPALFRIDGLVATPLPLPTPPGTDAWYRPAAIAADGTGLWMTSSTGCTSGACYYGVTGHRWDGSVWSTASELTPSMTPSTAAPFAYSTGGVGFALKSPDMRSLMAAAQSGGWDGSAWVSRSNWAAMTPEYQQYAAPYWTFASATDRTMWGYRLPGSAPGATDPAVGECRHVVGDTTTECPAPQWPVSAAVRRADGSVVLGGADVTPNAPYTLRAGTPAATTAGFALVPTPGAAPVALTGSNGDRVVALAAEPTGTAVWALTTSGSTSTLQVMGTPAKAKKAANPPRRVVPRAALR